MKNIILLLVNYNGNKSRVNYTWKLSGKLKNAVKNYQDYFYQFQYKRNLLGNPWELPVELGSAEHSLSITGLGKYRESNIV